MSTKVAERIRSRRKQLNLSQLELAEEVNVTKQAISNYEKGERTPSFDLLDALADALRTSMSYLLGATDDPSPRPSIDELSAEYEAELEREMRAWSLDDDDRRNPDRRLLFLLAKHGSDGDVRLAAALVKTLQDNNPHFYRQK